VTGSTSVGFRAVASRIVRVPTSRLTCGVTRARSRSRARGPDVRGRSRGLMSWRVIGARTPASGRTPVVSVTNDSHAPIIWLNISRHIIAATNNRRPTDRLLHSLDAVNPAALAPYLRAVAKTGVA